VSDIRQEARQKGTAVPKDTHRTLTTNRAQLELPEQVTVAVAELAGAAREGLLALAAGTGLQVLQAMLAEDVAGLVGAKGRHNPARAAVHHGSEPGQVTLGADGCGCAARGS
jgi:putative transposase